MVEELLLKTKNYYKDALGLDLEFIFGNEKYDSKYEFSDGSTIYLISTLEIKLDNVTIYRITNNINTGTFKRVHNSLPNNTFFEIYKEMFKSSKIQSLLEHLYRFNKHVFDSQIDGFLIKDVLLNRRFEVINYSGEDCLELLQLKAKIYGNKQ